MNLFNAIMSYMPPYEQLAYLGIIAVLGVVLIATLVVQEANIRDLNKVVNELIDDGNMFSSDVRKLAQYGAFTGAHIHGINTRLARLDTRVDELSDEIGDVGLEVDMIRCGLASALGVTIPALDDDDDDDDDCEDDCEDEGCHT